MKKKVVIDKHTWIEPGLQIKITLGAPSRENNEFNSFDHNNTNNIVPNSIHTITDRPTRKSRKNGYYGVWVEGIAGKIFLWYHEWIPFIEPVTMQRTKQTIIRTKQTITRNKYPAVQRTK